MSCSYLVRRETGKELGVKVLYDEGLASYIGPKPCVVSREGQGEASVGENVGWPLSHEMVSDPNADRLKYLEGNMSHSDIASSGTVRRGQRPQHAWKLLLREPGDLIAGQRVASCWSVWGRDQTRSP